MWEEGEANGTNAYIFVCATNSVEPRINVAARVLGIFVGLGVCSREEV